MFSKPHSEYFWKYRRVALCYSGIVVTTAAKRYPTKVELSFSTNSNFTRDLINACDVKSIQQLPRLVTNLKVDLLVNYFTKNTSSLSFIFALKIATVIRLCTEENLFCPAAVYLHDRQLPLHKKWSFPLRISLVNVTISILRIWSYLLRKSSMENFIFCAVFNFFYASFYLAIKLKFGNLKHLIL